MHFLGQPNHLHVLPVPVPVLSVLEELRVLIAVVPGLIWLRLMCFAMIECVGRGSTVLLLSTFSFFCLWVMIIRLSRTQLNVFNILPHVYDVGVDSGAVDHPHIILPVSVPRLPRTPALAPPSPPSPSSPAYPQLPLDVLLELRLGLAVGLQDLLTGPEGPLVLPQGYV